MSTKVYGNTTGLKAATVNELEKLYRRRTPPDKIVSPELARAISEISFELRRQVGVLINRKGEIEYVVVGDSGSVMLPGLGRTREGEKRFRGLRLVHTHLKHEPLSRDDLTDLALLRLDLVASIEVGDDGLPLILRAAHLLPYNKNGSNWNFIEPAHPANVNVNFRELISSLEEEFARKTPSGRKSAGRDRAILISVARDRFTDAEYSMEELKELAKTSGVEVVDSVIQRVHDFNPKFLLGKGKLADLVTRCMQLEADILIFDQNLSPAQAGSIAEFADMKVIDRTQLILDIFAQRAHSSEGKIQVELAQLKYTLPRLAGKGVEMSQLMGGIGGRGPGETKLEVDRRRARERVSFLERKIKVLGKERAVQRSKRNKTGVPVISIIGYTNAGKSTLLNNLTKSSFRAEEKMFATLDPASRRLRFPREREVIITDTVGFIRDLPPDLINAFRATLEELADADLLLHIVDISNVSYDRHINSVNKILSDLELNSKPILLVFNKIDRLDNEMVKNICLAHEDAIPVSAKNPDSFYGLLDAIQNIFWNESGNLLLLNSR